VLGGVTHVRVATLNLWSVGGVWDGRRDVLRSGFRSLQPDLIAFQEAYLTADRDTVREILDPELHVAHQTGGLLGDGNCAAIASRWPLLDVTELDQQLGPRTADFPVTTIVAEVDVPAPIGPVLFVNHLPSWKPQLEHERELQTVATAKFVEELVAERRRHVVLAGDLDAVPKAASIRFLRGLQSLGGTSVSYRDAWETIHPGDPVDTFTLRNPLMRRTATSCRKGPGGSTTSSSVPTSMGRASRSQAVSCCSTSPWTASGRATTSVWSRS